MSQSLENLVDLLAKQLPGAQVIEDATGFTVLSVHGQGATYEDAIRNALKKYLDAMQDGRNVRKMIDDIMEDLSNPGMSRQRHDSLIELINIASSAINDGVITGVIPWIQIPSLTRELDDLRRRTETRLNMIAQEMQAREKERAKLGPQKPSLRTQLDRAITDKWTDQTPATGQPIGLIAMANALQRA